jgi:tetratricopeptide (TPR) repeat protein
LIQRTSLGAFCLWLCLTLAVWAAPEDGLYLEGLALLKGRDYAVATDKFRQALTLNQVRPEIHFALGVALYQQDQLAGAHEAYLLALRYVPSPDLQARVRSGLGDIYFQLEDYARAAQFYRMALDTQSAWMGVRLKLATAYLRLFQYDSALEEVDLLLRFNPHLTEAYHLRSVIALARQDYRQALADVETVMRAYPEPTPELYQQLNWLYRMNLDYANARQVAQLLVQTFPAGESYRILADTQFEAAQHQLLLGKPTDLRDTMDAYQKYLLMQPQNALGYYRLGLVYQLQQRWSEALQAYRRAAELFPEQQTYRLAQVEMECVKGPCQHLATLLVREGQPANGDAAEIWLRLASTEPRLLPALLAAGKGANWPLSERRRLYFLQGYAHWFKGEREAALKIWDRPELIHWQGPEVDLMRAFRLGNSGSGRWSRDLFWQALRKRPQWWLPYFHLAEQQADSASERTFHFSELAWRLHPSSSEALNRLALSYRQTEQLADLQQLYQQGLRMYPHHSEWQSALLALLAQGVAKTETRP